jgi:hypothetical protein
VPNSVLGVVGSRPATGNYFEPIARLITGSQIPESICNYFQKKERKNSLSWRKNKRKEEERVIVTAGWMKTVNSEENK